MNVTCGTDIIEIDRVKDAIEKTGDKFLKRVFTKKEIEYCEGKKGMKYQHYAARFAAKEAVFKAVSDALNKTEDIGWTDIEIINNEVGKPQVTFLNIEIINLENIDISISHCKQYATANVVAVFKRRENGTI